MNGTPRIPSAYPATPQRSRPAQPSSLGNVSQKSRLPPAQEEAGATTSVIPLEVCDAATQRSIAFGIWIVLWTWKLKDTWTIYTSDDPDSLWLFMKWLLFDGIFLFVIPSLRIPWVEWSTSSMTIIFLVHAILDASLMFQIGLPLAFWAEWLLKQVWDRGEISVSERFVRTNQVIDTKSLLQGKHVINILPEGSASLNPNDAIFCIGANTKQISIPIQINQTQPVLIELLRRDFDTQTTEILTIKASEANRLRRAAVDQHKKTRGVPHPDDPLLLQYPVKKTGQYTIRKILDESKLHVRPRASEAVVVSCPSARIVVNEKDRCRGDLSDIAFEVHGTAPLKLKYRKLINGNPTEASFQSIQPSDFVSAAARSKQLSQISSAQWDIAWAQSQKVTVPINESLIALGKYNYLIDEVEDSLGNRVVYYNRQDDEDAIASKHPEISQIVTVHDRPAISIPANAGCNAERPLKVAAGQEIQLPHQIVSAGQSEYSANYRNEYAFNDEHLIEYEYFSEAVLSQTNADSSIVNAGSRKSFKKVKRNDAITIKEPGLYVIKDIRTKYCAGEVSEPSSCLVQNPIKPSVKVSSTEITHKCANSPIGLQVSFDFEGTPPFKVRYTEEDYTSGRSELRTQSFNGYRGQIDIRQHTAGRYKYTFKSVSDHYYDNERIGTVLEQDVKPSASAFLDSQVSREDTNICLGGTAKYSVGLTGDAPWNLEYEIIHGKSRKKYDLANVSSNKVEIEADDLKEGGEYTLALTSVTDASGCKEFLKDQLKFHVWSQKPTAAFGKVNGQFSTSILEGNTLRLPLRFTGQAGFAYMVEETVDGVNKTTTEATNAAVHSLNVKRPGTYKLLAMRDQYCTGEIESAASQFVVDWIPRPSLALALRDSLEQKDSVFIKPDVCEGEDDNVDIQLQGAPPFEVKYEEHGKPDEGQKSLKARKLNVAFGAATIPLDTAKAGLYEYRFQDVSDANYDADSRRKANTVLQQRVRSRPSAKFGTPGHTYSFCTTEGSSDEVVSIRFSGTPPFTIDIDIRHSSSASPESMTLDQIKTNTYDLHLPRRYLRSGHSHLTIRRVRDGRGCQSKVDPNVQPSRVHVSVHEPPNISALEARDDYCIGEYFSYRLTGVPPFTIYYSFEGEKRKAVEKTLKFTRFNAMAGQFTITSISDSSSKCQFSTSLQKTIHPNPGVKVDDGREVYADIHEGGESEVVFQMSGTPPFEITYTRSELAKKGAIGRVVETKTVRTNEMVLRKMENQGGSIEPLSVRDKWCLTSKEGGKTGRKGPSGQKLLTN